MQRDRLFAQCEVAKNMFAEERSSTATDVFHRLCEMPNAFPDLLACFVVVLTLPVASASAERTFSVMRRVKSHLRASMGDDRLSCLSLIAVERELSEKLLKDPSKVIDEFASCSNRRISLLL